MGGWPAITEPLLRERQAMSDEEFFAYFAALLKAIGERDMPDDHYERAIGYPWARPPGSCLVTDGNVEDVDDPELVRGYLEDDKRVPLVTYGANAAPGRLAIKLAHLPKGHRRALIVAGMLEGFDIGVAAQPPVFNSMPATPISSPGTAARVAVLYLTDVQFTALWWTEVSYTVGALEDVTLTTALTEEPIRRVIAFVSRYGAFCVDGAPVAMAAIPAAGRRHAALTQLEVLDSAARLTLGDDANALDIVREAYEHPAAFLAAHRAALHARSLPLRSEHWRAMPPGAS